MILIIYKSTQYEGIQHHVATVTNKHKMLKIVNKLRKEGYYVNVHTFKPYYTIQYKTIYYPIL